MSNILQNTPDSAQDLKQKANEAYTQRDFSASFDIYTYIVTRYVDAPLSFIRTVRCNRGACCIELGRYEEGVKDLQWVLQCIPDGAQDSLESTNLNKARFRLARCLLGVKRYGDALRELDRYREKAGSKVEAESILREEILQAITERDELDRIRGRMMNKHTVSGRRLRYEVKIFMKEPTIVIPDDIPDALCSTNPPKLASRLFAIQLLKKYHKFLMDQQEWRCWKCHSRAISLIHTPALYFHLPEPKVVDYAQPICEDGGACDFAARKMMEEAMLLSATLGKEVHES